MELTLTTLGQRSRDRPPLDTEQWLLTLNRESLYASMRERDTHTQRERV